MDCTALSPTESQMLGIYEAQIKSGLTHFLEVGTALMKVRDGKLYRQSHPNFEAYCREKWDIGRDRAEQLCKAASVVETLPTIVGKPKKESQARELSKIDDPEVRAEIWEEAVAEASEESDGERQPTAKQVRAAVNKRKTPSPAKPVDKTPQWLREGIMHVQKAFAVVHGHCEECTDRNEFENTMEHGEAILEKIRKAQ